MRRQSTFFNAVCGETDRALVLYGSFGPTTPGVMMDVLSVPANSVVMGGAALDVPRVLVLPVPSGGPPIEDLVGNVGSGCFRSGSLTLDYPGRRVIFAPGQQSAGIR